MFAINVNLELRLCDIGEGSQKTAAHILVIYYPSN